MRTFRFRLLLFLCAVLGACNATRKLPEGQRLLVKNNISVKGARIDKDELILLEKQKPNRKVLFVRFYLGLYTLGSKGPNGWFGKWLMKIGEEPVIFDTSLAELTNRQFVLAMFRKGYFDASCKDSIVVQRKKFFLDFWHSSYVPYTYKDSSTYKLKKRVMVYYKITAGQPYFIRNTAFRSKDLPINDILKSDSINSLLKPGDRYSEDAINDERARITKLLRNNGYFYFNRNYVNVLVDSSLGTHQADLVVNVSRINEKIDSANAEIYKPEDHKVYFLNNIYIQTDYDPANPDASLRTDTTMFQDYYFLKRTPKSRFREKTIADAIFFRKGDRFFQDDLDYTYTRISALNVFRFTNIRYDDAGTDSIMRNLLNSYIQLTPRKSQGFSVETEVTHSGGNIGIAGSFGYVNWNTFRGAEALEVKIHGSIENLATFSDTIPQQKIFGLFNTYEVGPEIKLTLKNSPFFLKDRRFNPRTTLASSYTYQSRPDYKRGILNLSFGWHWRGKGASRYSLLPAEVSSIYVNLTPEFSDYLTKGSYNLAFLYSYSPHLITSGRFIWLYTNQNQAKPGNFWFVRGTFEAAGNTLWALDKLGANLPKDADGNSQFFGLTFSQYIKPEIDISYHDWLNPNSSIVYRFNAGVGFSYGNSNGKILPFEKAFFSGGANSIRAWNARTLGPGSFIDTTNSGYSERIGDLKLEANFEYRSVIFKYLEGAAFIDMGNMWVRKDPTGSFHGGTFQWNHLPDDIAIGAGLGARLNFNFFIIRLDGAVKLRNPALPDGREWVYRYEKPALNDVVLNFAIGYPF